MGASDVVPGVSGGTMAFILGIYEELIEAIKSFDLQSLRHLFTFRFRALFERLAWPFLLSLGIGILTAVFTLARLLAWLLQNTPVLLWSFFLGLILGSVISVTRRVHAWTLLTWICLATGLAGSYILVGMVPAGTPDMPWFYVLSGGVAICAMILPGISGSFILVLLGKYRAVLEAVNQRDFLTLFWVVLGAGAGIVFFSRLLSWLLKRFYDLTVAFLIGLMLGSLRKIWPWKETIETMTDAKGRVFPVVQTNVFPSEWSQEVVLALGLMVLGFLVVFILDRMASKK
jgi:putative membrane protein